MCTYTQLVYSEPRCIHGLANGEPVRKRAKPAKISPLLKAHKKALATAAAHSLHEDVETALTKVDAIVDELALKHGKCLTTFLVALPKYRGLFKEL